MFSWGLLVRLLLEVKVEQRHGARIAVCCLDVPFVQDEVVLMEQLGRFCWLWYQLLGFLDMVHDYLANISYKLLSIQLQVFISLEVFASCLGQSVNFFPSLLHDPIFLLLFFGLGILGGPVTLLSNFRHELVGLLLKHSLRDFLCIESKKRFMLLLLDHRLCLASVVVLGAHVVVVIRDGRHLRCHQKFELLVALFLMLLLLLQLSFFC